MYVRYSSSWRGGGDEGRCLKLSAIPAFPVVKKCGYSGMCFRGRPEGEKPAGEKRILGISEMGRRRRRRRGGEERERPDIFLLLFWRNNPIFPKLVIPENQRNQLFSPGQGGGGWGGVSGQTGGSVCCCSLTTCMLTGWDPSYDQ